jgi:hypothetical protein
LFIGEENGFVDSVLLTPLGEKSMMRLSDSSSLDLRSREVGYKILDLFLVETYAPHKWYMQCPSGEGFQMNGSVHWSV